MKMMAMTMINNYAEDDGADYDDDDDMMNNDLDGR